MVRMLDDYGANGTHKNNDGICPIDVAITEDMRDIKLHFLAQQKYKNFDFTGLGGLSSVAGSAPGAGYGTGRDSNFNL
jgi:hypothetical protein